MLESQLNSGTVTCKHVQLIAFGVTGAYGSYVLQLVAEECKQELARF